MRYNINIKKVLLQYYNRNNYRNTYFLLVLATARYLIIRRSNILRIKQHANYCIFLYIPLIAAADVNGSSGPNAIAPQTEPTRAFFVRSVNEPLSDL